MSAYSDRILADGAIAYWRLDEVSGNVVSKVGGYTGTVTGGVTRSQPGALSDGNTAMAFDGSSSYVSVPSLTLQFPDNCSVEAWVRLTSPPNPQEIVGFWKPGTSGLRLRCDGRLQCYLEVAGTGFFIVGATTGRFDNAWHHVVFVRSGGTTGTIYVDGVVDGTAAAAAGVLTVSPAPIVIGARPDSPTQWFAKGTLDEVAIYPTALTPAQISQHYALSSYNPSAVTGLLSAGRAHAIKQLVPYALPARTAWVESDATLEYAMTLDGPWFVKP